MESNEGSDLLQFYEYELCKLHDEKKENARVIKQQAAAIAELTANNEALKQEARTGAFKYPKGTRCSVGRPDRTHRIRKTGGNLCRQDGARGLRGELQKKKPRARRRAQAG